MVLATLDVLTLYALLVEIVTSAALSHSRRAASRNSPSGNAQLARGGRELSVLIRRVSRPGTA
jgi:hypothetical protein